MYPNWRKDTFAIARIYKKKADKVKPVDPNGTDGSKLGGILDWVERSRARDIVPSEVGRYTEWLIPKFSDISRGSRLTKERADGLLVGEGL